MMFKLLIAIPFVISLAWLGLSWAEIAVALAIVLAFTYGLMMIETYIQRTAQLRVPRDSAKYSATYFAIVSIGSAASTYFLRNSHMLLWFAVTLAVIGFASSTAQFLFGEPIE